VIEIEFVSGEPVEGWARYVTRSRPPSPLTEIRFSGWLGLVQALEILRSSEVSADGLGRELRARRDGDLAEDAP
jgi:hypothetical protein